MLVSKRRFSEVYKLVNKVSYVFLTVPILNNIISHTRRKQTRLFGTWRLSIRKFNFYESANKYLKEIVHMTHQMCFQNNRDWTVYKKCIELLSFQCFDCSIILSQQELRRVVYALEEWMQNVDASVSVYEKMRKFYPRPEHQCICGGNVKPQNITHRYPERLQCKMCSKFYAGIYSFYNRGKVITMNYGIKHFQFFSKITYLARVNRK